MVLGITLKLSLSLRLQYINLAQVSISAKATFPKLCRNILCNFRVCFDNFNHIEACVLSVVAHYIQTIQEATKSAQQNFIIDGITLPMNLSCAIFTTLSSLDPMNCHEKLQYA